MHRGRDHADRIGQALALPDLLAHQHDRARGRAQMLLQRQIEHRRHRHHPHRRIGGRALAIIWMNAPVATAQGREQVHESHGNLRPSPVWA
jgi:hypothetical protein